MQQQNEPGIEGSLRPRKPRLRFPEGRNSASRLQQKSLPEVSRLPVGCLADSYLSFQPTGLPYTLQTCQVPQSQEQVFKINLFLSTDISHQLVSLKRPKAGTPNRCAPRLRDLVMELDGSSGCSPVIYLGEGACYVHGP